MIRNSRRVIALAIAGALVIAPAVSGCGAGTSPQTAMPTQLTEGVNAGTASGIQIRNLFVLGPATDQQLKAGGSAPVYGVIINGSTDGKSDKLVAVTSSAFRQGARLNGGGITLPPNELISLTNSPKPAQAADANAGTTPSAAPTGKATKNSASSATPGAPAEGAGAIAASGPPVVLSGSIKQLLGGETIEVVLQFERGGSITLQVPVVPHAGDYATYSPAPGLSSPAAKPSGDKSPAAAATLTP